MKKIIFVFLVSLASVNVHAQLSNTKWKGTIHSDNDIDVVFDCKIDTMDVINAADGSSLETLTYSVKDSIFTLQKVYGQSSCDATAVGKYVYAIKDDILTFTLISDACDDRSGVLNNSKWNKVK